MNASLCEKVDLRASRSCGKLCGCEGRHFLFAAIDQPVRIFRHSGAPPKAMFLSWLTVNRMATDETSCESALSSQKVRFAHKPRGCRPHRQRLAACRLHPRSLVFNRTVRHNPTRDPPCSMRYPHPFCWISRSSSPPYHGHSACTSWIRRYTSLLRAPLAIGCFVCLFGYSVESLGAPDWAVVAAPVPLDILLLWYVLKTPRKMAVAYVLIWAIYIVIHVFLSAILHFDSLIPAWRLHH